MKRQIMGTLGLLSLLALAALTLRRPSAEASTAVVGTSVEVGRNEIVVAPRVRPGAACPANVRFIIDPVRTQVVRCELDVGGVRTDPGQLADLRAGQPVSVSAKGSNAVEVKILPPAMITGSILTIRGSSLSLQVRGSGATTTQATQTFVIDPDRTRLMASTFEGAPRHAVHLSALRVGQSVRVFASDGVVSSLQIVPPQPTVGKLLSISQSGIRIACEPTRGEPKAEEREFLVDWSRAEVFQKHFGLPVIPASMSELQAGQSVAVVVEEGRAAGIAMTYPPIYGSISSVSGNSVVVATTGTSTLIYGPQQVLQINSQSGIFLGKWDHRFRTRGGRDARLIQYPPGGTVWDLRAGQSVSVTAVGNAVVAMRVIPPPQGKQGNK